MIFFETNRNLPGTILVGLLVFIIRAYRLFLSPVLPNSCRFVPTCSRYAEQALVRHGLLRGLYLTFMRLARCHPWHKGGYDPVP